MRLSINAILIGLSEPDEILVHLDEMLFKNLKSKRRNKFLGAVKIGICSIDKRNYDMLFSGAGLDLWVFDNYENHQIVQADNKTLAGLKSAPDQKFVLHSLQYDSRKSYYLFSDGVINQVDERGEAFGIKKLISILMDFKSFGFKIREGVLKDAIQKHMSDQAQNDDITILGFTV